MDAFIVYLLKSAVCLAVFYICVKVLLSNETFFRFNRWVLLLGMSVCFILPLIEVSTKEVSAIQSPALFLENAISEIPLAVPEAGQRESLSFSGIEIAAKSPVGWGTAMLCVYFVGLAVRLWVLSRSAYSLIKLVRRGKKEKYPDYSLVLIPENITPFSWGRYIVLSESDYQNNPQEIITHELAHTRHRHSLDLIYMELILLLQWFNPVVWFLKRELKDVHEYQADRSVLNSGVNATKYQLLLVEKAVGTSSYTLANSFNHSKIKKRITMMLKEKSSKWARLKLLLLLPLGTLTVFAFARPEVNEPLSSLVEYESTTILPEKEEIREIIPQESEKKPQESEKKAQEPKKKQSSAKKPDNYNPEYYTADGEKLTDAEYKELMENSIPLIEPYYIPFANGKVVKVQGVFNTGMLSPVYYRERFINGKEPDRSHVDLIVNGVRQDFDGTKTQFFGDKFTNKEKAEKEAKKRGKEVIELKLIKKDRTMATAPWYIVPIKFAPPPPIPPL